MRFFRPYVVTAILCVAALLSACGSGDTSPTPSATVTVSPSVTVTGTPTASAPAMPEAAKAHTKEGAEAFVRHFWEVVNYAQETGDTGPVEVLSADGCKSCDAGIAGIRKVFDDDGRYVGGTHTITGSDAEILQAGDQRFAQVTVQLRIARLTIVFGDGRESVHRPGNTFRETFDLIAVPGSWLVGQFQRA